MGRPRKIKNPEKPICPWSRDEKRQSQDLLGDLEGKGNYWFVKREVIGFNEETRWMESLKLSNLIEKIPFREWRERFDEAKKVTLWDNLYEQPILIEPLEYEIYGMSVVDDPDEETEYIIPDPNDYDSDY